MQPPLISCYKGDIYDVPETFIYLSSCQGCSIKKGVFFWGGGGGGAEPG